MGTRDGVVHLSPMSTTREPVPTPLVSLLNPPLANERLTGGDSCRRMDAPCFVSKHLGVSPSSGTMHRRRGSGHSVWQSLRSSRYQETTASLAIDSPPSSGPTRTTQDILFVRHSTPSD